MDFGQILTELRTERGIYQKELAVQLKVSIGTISNYENNVHFPDLSTLCKLADFFGVTTDYLLGRTRYRYNPQNLNQQLTKDYTVADLVNTTLELSPKNVTSMLDYVELLRIRQRSESSGR